MINGIGWELNWTELLAAASFRLYFPKYFLSFSTITTVLYTTIIILVGERERERLEFSLNLSLSLLLFAIIYRRNLELPRYKGDCA